jgi:hypothetical protein
MNQKQKDFSDPSIKKLCEDVSDGRRFDEASRYDIENYLARMWHYGMVYIVNVGENYYKIGKTTNLHGRMMTFRVCNPYVRDSSQVIALIYPKAARNPGVRGWHPKWTSGDLETYIHQMLRAKSTNDDEARPHKMGGGREIFRLDEEDLKSLFAALVENSMSKRKPPRHRTPYLAAKLKKNDCSARPAIVGGFVPREIVDQLVEAEFSTRQRWIASTRPIGSHLSAQLPGDGRAAPFPFETAQKSC